MAQRGESWVFKVQSRNSGSTQSGPSLNYQQQQQQRSCTRYQRPGVLVVVGAAAPLLWPLGTAVGSLDGGLGGSLYGAMSSGESAEPSWPSSHVGTDGCRQGFAARGRPLCAIPDLATCNSVRPRSALSSTGMDVLQHKILPWASLSPPVPKRRSSRYRRCVDGTEDTNLWAHQRLGHRTRRNPTERTMQELEDEAMSQIA